MSRLRELTAELRGELTRFEADRWSGRECAAIAEDLARTQKACAAASACAAARAVECHAGDVEWVARTSGATPSQARESLATTAALDACPATGDAVAAGVVSLSQAREIVRAEEAVPGSEAGLLAVATARGHGGSAGSGAPGGVGRRRSRRVASSPVGGAVAPSLGRR